MRISPVRLETWALAGAAAKAKTRTLANAASAAARERCSDLMFSSQGEKARRARPPGEGRPASQRRPEGETKELQPGSTNASSRASLGSPRFSRARAYPAPAPPNLATAPRQKDAEVQRLEADHVGS
jgi:hypothetical protein